MLVVKDELKRLLCWITQFGILCHPIRFAQGNRRYAMAIETHELCFAGEQIAIRPLLADKPLKAAVDRVLVLTGLVGVTGTEKREQCQSGAGSRRFEAAPAVALVTLT